MRSLVRALAVLLVPPCLAAGQERATAPIDVGRLRPSQEQYLEERAKALSEPDPALRRAAILALSGAGDAATPVVVRVLRESRNPLRQRAALLALYEIGTPGATAELVRAWERGDLREEERIVLALALGARQREDALPELRQLAEARRAPELRRAATIALGRMRDVEGLKRLLVRLSREASAEHRAAVVTAAGATGDRVLLPAVLENLTDDEAPVRRAVAFAIGEVGEAVELEPLIRQARRERDDEVRAAFALAWGRIDHPSALDSLERATRDRSSAVREAAWAALAARVDGADLVVAALAQEHDSARRAALARACAGAPASAALAEALVVRLQDRKPEVRAAAGRALAALEHRDDPQLLLGWLDHETDEAARRDAVLVAGVLGLPGALDVLAKRPLDTASGRRVVRALRGRLDPRLLREELEERLREEGGRLVDRRDEELDGLVVVALDLDDIVRRRPGAGGPGGPVEPGPGGFGGKPPRIDRRDSSYERDLAEWFEVTPYFPRGRERRQAH